MKTWEFVHRRRKTTLASFLSDVTTLQEALEKFKRRDIIPPDIERIEEALPSSISAPKQQPSAIAKKKSKKSKKEEEEYDNLVIINTNEEIIED